MCSVFNSFVFVALQIFGELPGGILIRVSLFAAKKLLSPDCVVLNTLSR